MLRKFAGRCGPVMTVKIFELRHCQLVTWNLRLDRDGSMEE
jgi:hypothetical protein